MFIQTTRNIFRKDVCLNQPLPEYQEPLPFPKFPDAQCAMGVLYLYNCFSCSWFLSVYVKEIWSRLLELLAASTAVYGSILKIDSTKKVCEKLQGAAINSVSWCTNVGNKYGEVLIPVLTESEGLLG